jgi:hypothetical protein
MFSMTSASSRIHHPARGADDDLSALFETPELSFVRLPAVNRQSGDPALKQRQLVDLLGNLDGQLACRAQDQNLDLPQVGVNLLDRRDGERGGFAGAGLGLADHVLAREQNGDGLRLDGRCLFKPQFINGFQGFRRQAKFRK